MLADVLDHARNLLALNNGLVNCFAELLNQFAQTGCQGLPPRAALTAKMSS